MTQKILISSQSNKFSKLPLWAADNGIELIWEPFITNTPVDFEPPLAQHYQWVFFSSANAAKIVLQRQHRSTFEGKKLAALSQGTAKAVQSLGFTCSYIGQGTVDHISSHFKQVLQSNKVWFPISNISRKTVQAQLTTNSYFDTIVYKTEDRTSKLNLNDFEGLVILTSPSNALSYLQQTRVLKNKLYIAFGKSVYFTLQRSGIESVTPIDYSQDSLLELIKSLQ